MSAEHVGEAESSGHPGIRQGVGLSSRKLGATTEAAVVSLDVQRGTERLGQRLPKARGVDPVEQQGDVGTRCAGVQGDRGVVRRKEVNPLVLDRDGGRNDYLRANFSCEG